MRLHLPKALLAAVLAAGILAFSSSVQADTPAYSGGIYTWCNTDTTTADIATGAWALSTLGADGSYAYGDPITNWNTNGSTKIQDLFAPASENTSNRNTLRFDSSKGSNRSIEFTFTPLNIAGIIVETGSTGYGIVSGGTQGNARSIYIGNNNPTAAYSTIHENFSIRNTASSHANTGIFLRGTQTISIDSGKTLSLYAGKAGISISGSLTLTSGGTLALTGATTNNGALNIGSNVLLKVSESINNVGSITFSSGVSIDLNQLIKASQFTTSETTTGFHTATGGSFTFATGTGTVTATDSPSCLYDGVSATVSWSDDHKTGTITSVGYYYIAENDTKTYSEAITDTPAWITVSERGTLSVGSGTIDTEINGGGTISVSAGSGELSVSAEKLREFTGNLVVNSGRFNEIANGHVFNNVTVQNGGQFFIEDSCAYNGNVSIAGTGWNGSGDQAATGALRLGNGAVLSGTLTLASDANVRVHVGGTGSISSSLDSNYILTKVGGGTLLLSGPSIDLKGITVSDGSLYLGGDHNNKGSVTEVTAVALDSLTIQQGKSVTANYMKGTIKSVELAGGTFNYRDCYEKNDANALNITTMTVSANSAFTRTWKGIVNVSELTGTGNIDISNINAKASTDVVNLNVTMLKDYTGTISSSTDKVALKISSVSQSADKQGTISSAATLADGFTKTGAGAISFGGTTNATDVTVSSGSLTFAGGTSISKLSLNGGTTTISGATTVGGIKENGIIAANDTIKLTISDTGTLTHEGFEYTGTELSGLSHGLTMGNGNNDGTIRYNVIVSGGSITQTDTSKDIYAKLSDVKLINTAGKTSKLGVDANLSGASISGTLEVGNNTTTTIKNTVTGSTDSSIATLTGSGTLKTTGGTTTVTNASGFSGTLEATTGGSLEANGTTTGASGTVTLSSLAGLKATGGSIELTDVAATLTVTDLVVAGNGSISGAESYMANKVSIGAGEAGSLVGNLSIQNGGTITLDASAGATTATGGTKGLSLSSPITNYADEGTTTTMGSLTLGSGLTLNLANLGRLAQGESLTLFSGVTEVIGLTDENLTALGQGTLAAETVFSSGVGTGNYNLRYRDNVVSLVAQKDTPEPTTATLSLLALMALAARRRRKA